MEVADWTPDPEQRYGASEFRDILIKALATLRPALRTVFVLRDIEGLSTLQTAEVLSLSQSAVKARLWRARLQLRELLNRYFRKETGSAQMARYPQVSDWFDRCGINGRRVHIAALGVNRLSSV